MIVNGGRRSDNDDWLANGAAYDPTSHTSTPLPTGAALNPLFSLGGAWTGTRLLVADDDRHGPRGAPFDPSTRAWSPLATCTAPRIIWQASLVAWPRTSRVAGWLFTP